MELKKKESHFSKYKGIYIPIAFFLLIVYILVICIYPEYHIQWYYHTLTGKEQLDSIKDMRGGLINIGAGILAIIGIYLTWRRTKALDDQNGINQKNIEINQKNYDALVNKTEQERIANEENLSLEREKLDQEKEENEKKRIQEKEVSDNNFTLQQFSKASELLNQSGDENIAARLSGIYLFEKIMNANEDYHWQVIELLTAYVREKRDNKKYDCELSMESDHPNIEIDEDTKTNYFVVVLNGNKTKRYFRVPIEKDIQAIITVLGRRDRKLEKDIITGKNLEELIEELDKSIQGDNNKNIISEALNRINQIKISNINLYKADFNQTHFENIMCIKVIFYLTQHEETNFQKSIFNNTYFYQCTLGITNYSNAIIIQSKFVNSNFWSTNFENTYVIETILENYSQLYPAQLSKATCLKAVTGLSNEMKEEIVRLNPTLKGNLFPENEK